jgi:hypothetical protein
LWFMIPSYRDLSVSQKVNLKIQMFYSESKK